MAPVDFLQELKLDAYYPRRLSISEAIRLPEDNQKVHQEQYGLHIVRKLLMFDSTALISVTTEINERLNNRGKKRETGTTEQRVSDDVRPSGKVNVRPPKLRDKEKGNELELHPMDLLIFVMSCCDDFLRQVLVEKMFTNKLSVPILLPDVRNGVFGPTLLLFAMRSLVPEVPNIIQKSSASLTDILVDIENPIVSFIRVGDLHRSKSKLVNELLKINSFNTFFHRKCPHGSAKRSVSIGSIEAAWFQSETANEDEFNCRFFTALNLRGNAGDYPRQTQFLCQSSTVVVFMVGSYDQFKKLYENVLKGIKLPQTKTIVCHVSPLPADNDDETYFEFLDSLIKHGEIYTVKYDWSEERKLSDVDFTNDLRKTISEIFKLKLGVSDQMRTYTSIIQSGQNFGFLLDEDKLEYTTEKSSAENFLNLVSKQPQDCKPILFPLQDEPWTEIGKLERVQRGKSQSENQDEKFIAKKETEKRSQREIQCRSLIQQNEIARTFFEQFHLLKEQSLLRFLNYCMIKLDSRSRIIATNLIQKYNEKEKLAQQLKSEAESKVKLCELETKIENSTIGLEHILRECGQMYEAVISEEIRMREEFKTAPFSPDVIRNFPSIVAQLLLIGQSLELMDGDASNVPITWLKAVLNKIGIMTNNAKVFVLSIIGVQSSGKSTLLNALFGLQFPVSAGRCTRGIYCHLVPVDKNSFRVEYDYVLVVDTEGIGSAEFTGKSTFRDNELATFAIGLADATIINMKGENWSELKDILQIAAYGLIRVRKTKSNLELMPSCMFVHQNVPAVDAEQKNQLGQEKQLQLLDKAIKAAGSKEGFTEITRFDQVIKYDPHSHSWYFPDLWNGRPPKARISQDYIEKTNELRQHLMQVMKAKNSKLTLSSFSHRMSDLWNAMLHNDFVLCFRNTNEMISGTVLNDKISNEVDSFKTKNKIGQKIIQDSIGSFNSVDVLRAEKERILKEVSDVVENNFTSTKSTLKGAIDASDICAALKDKYETSLIEIKEGELRRTKDETIKAINVHMKKLEYDSDHKVKRLKARLALLEGCTEEVEKEKLDDAEIKAFEELWQQLIVDNRKLIDERIHIVAREIEKSIGGSIAKLILTAEMQLTTSNWAELFNSPVRDVMPQVSAIDIAQREERASGWVRNLIHSDSYILKANNRFHAARKKWDLQFENERDLEFNAVHLEEIIAEVGQLLGISKREETEVRPVTDEICSALPPGNCFSRDYITRFVKFACHYTYNRSLENSKRFISITYSLTDIDERHKKATTIFRLMSVDASSDDVSTEIFDFALRSFIIDLGELIKTEVCKDDTKDPTFKSKRAFLRAILTDLGQKTRNLTLPSRRKQKLFEDFLLYIELGESDASKDFFLDAILKFLKEMLTNDNAYETDFQNMVINNVGKVIESAKYALRKAETNCKGCAKEYVQIFEDFMNVTGGVNLRVDTSPGFTEAVLKKLDNLYTEFLKAANSSFEQLARENDKAALEPLFEKIMGCRERCPFCSAPCSQSLEPHAGYHRANHYPTGVTGTVKIKGVIKNTHNTHDTIRRGKREKLSLYTCHTIVGTKEGWRSTSTMRKHNKWFHKFFNLDYDSLKNYQEIAEYENWDIPHSKNHNVSLYWKWFMAQYVEELAVYYEARIPKIPEAWQRITWEEANQSLNELC